MSHIFISYSKKNKDYAYALADFLQAHGFNIWIDRTGIDYGVDWWDAIVEGLRDCAAFLVVMTPESRISNWVKREVGLALHWEKPVYPLLLNGDNWELFVLTQFADVRDRSLPDDDLLKRLSQHVTPHGKGVNLSRLTSEAQPAPPMATSAPPPPAPPFDMDAAIDAFGTAVLACDWSEALNMLGRIRASGKTSIIFDADAQEGMVQNKIELDSRARVQEERLAERDRQYKTVQSIARFSDAAIVWNALQKFWAAFPDFPNYDPANLARDVNPDKPRLPTKYNHMKGVGCKMG
jgi:hypothetical protein